MEINSATMSSDVEEEENHPANKKQQLPVTVASASPSKKKLTLLPLVFLIYFEVAGGPYGEETVVKAAGVLRGILGFVIFPFVWSLPEALMTTELATAFPGDGSFVTWTTQAFGPFFGSFLGTLKFFSCVINVATFPVLGVNYMQQLYPMFKKGRPRYLAIILSTLFFSGVNCTGLENVGWGAVCLGVVSVAPSLILSFAAMRNIEPKRWLSLGQEGVKTDYRVYFNTLFWNLNYWDSVSTMAGEVDKPKKTFPRAMLIAVIFTCIIYLLPLMAVTGYGDLPLDQNMWDTGFLADAAEIIVGKWLKTCIEIGAVVSSIGLFEAQMSSCTYQVSGMANVGFLPKFCGARAKWFNTPWVGIVVACLISIGASFMNFQDIVGSANHLYSLGMLLEFAAFVWLRIKKPTLKRPYRIPLNVPCLIVMCLVPSSFLVYIMSTAKLKVLIVSGGMTAFAILWYFIMRFFKFKKWCVFAEPSNEDQG